MKSIHTISIEVEWLGGARYAVADRRIRGNHIEDPRSKPWWWDDDCILIERPKAEPRFYTRSSPVSVDRTHWTVFDRETDAWVGTFCPPHAERHAREFADMLNREAGE